MIVRMKILGKFYKSKFSVLNKKFKKKTKPVSAIYTEPTQMIMVINEISTDPGNIRENCNNKFYWA